MKSSILFQHFFFPVASIKLGRFTVSIDNPHQEYHDPLCAGAPEAIITSREDYGGSDQGVVSAGFKSALTSFISSGISKRAKTDIRITTDHVKTYILGNSGQWFAEAMSLEVTRKWVERSIDQGDDIYIIVGFHTVSNARIIHESVLGREIAGQIKFPVGLTLAAVGAVAPLGNIVDTSFTGHHQVSEGGQIQFVAPGEQICALQYRKVCHRWLSSRRIDNTFLSKNPRWTTYDRSRDEEETEEDIIEVETMELEEPEGDWERQLALGGEVLLLRTFDST